MVKDIEEYIYLKIPEDYICIYNKLLIYLAKFGKELLDDCSSTCKTKNKTILDCWAMFQSAIANRALGNCKEANFLINYIDKQLSNIYKIDGIPNIAIIYYEIDEKGYLKSTIDCETKIKFIVDDETGYLQQWIYNDKTGNEFIIDNSNLVIKYKKNYDESVC